jgi:chromosome segregation ATPase
VQHGWVGKMEADDDFKDFEMHWKITNHIQFQYRVQEKPEMPTTDELIEKLTQNFNDEAKLSQQRLDRVEDLEKQAANALGITTGYALFPVATMCGRYRGAIARIEELDCQAAHLQDMLKAETLRSTARRATANNLSTERGKLVDKLNQLEVARNNALETIRRLRDSLESANQRIKEHESGAECLRAAVSKEQRVSEALGDSVDALEKERNDLRRNVSALMAENRRLLDAEDRLNSDLSMIRAGRERAQGMSERLERQNGKLLLERDKAITDLGGAKSEIATLRDANFEVYTNNRKLAEQVTILKEGLRDIALHKTASESAKDVLDKAARA